MGSGGVIMNRLKSSVAKLILILGVVLWLLPFFSFTVYASTGNPRVSISTVNGRDTETQVIDETITEINTDIAAKFPDLTDFLTVTNKSGTTQSSYTIEMNMLKYTKYTQLEKQKIMEYALNGIKNSDISTTNKTRIYNFIADSDSTVSSLVRQLSSDVTADYVGAYGIFKPWTGRIGIALGLLTLVTFALLGIAVAVDIFYITVPAFQLLVANFTNNDKPKFVSVEAFKAIKDAESDKGNGSPLSLFFKLKTKQFIVMGICLLYLTSGKIYTLIAYIIDMFSGFVVR